MQEMAECDNNRTPVIFEARDIYRFVGDTAGFKRLKKPEIHASYLQSSTSEYVRQINGFHGG